LGASSTCSTWASRVSNPGASTIVGSVSSWGRFYETVSPEIIKLNLIWYTLSLQLWPCMALNTSLCKN
jgi:hypothetical protein